MLRQFSFISLAGLLVLSAKVFAAPSNLSPAALECYDSVMTNPMVLPNYKTYKGSILVERLTVSLCTYSNALGATKCFLDSKADPQVLPATKEVTNIVGLEEKFVQLCANSRATEETQEIDAVGCFKALIQRKDLLPTLAASTAVNWEKTITTLCTSSNAKGAALCLENAMAHPEEVLKDFREVATPFAKENEFVRLCKGSRVK